MAYGTRTATATRAISIAAEDNLSKSMNNYTGGTTLTFNMNINSNGYDLVYNKDTLEIMDVMGSKMSLATWKNNYFVVKDKDGNELTAATSEKIKDNEYYVTQVENENGTAYKIIVPDSKALTITYLVTVDAALGEIVNVSNKAYFNYDGLNNGSSGASTEQRITISRASASTGTDADASFKIYKQDQWGGPVAGVTFALYTVQLDDNGTAQYGSDGQVVLDSLIATKTTDSTGFVEFTNLLDSEVYCFYETNVPSGYVVAPERTYFYFTEHENLNIASAIGIDYNEKVFTVTNRFSSADLTVPLKKTINGEEQSSSSPFSFTLQQTSGATVYSDEKCTNAVTSIQTTIKGSGTTKFNTLYFKEAGTYTFTLSENDLTSAEIAEGFAKSNVVYTVTATVVNGGNGLYMDSATYTDGTTTGNLLYDDIPAFNNTLTLNPVTVTLNAKKMLTGSTTRACNIGAGEFKFEVVENSEVIATGKTKKGDKTSSEIEFTGITYNQNQLGTHMLTIYEVSGNDSTITYSDLKFVAKVVVEPAEGEANLKATVTYLTNDKSNLDANGWPVFTNTYTPLIVATGIRLNTAPFVIMFALAASLAGGMMITRRRRRRG
jgi:pilin isopeptide linkage protein